MTEYEIQKGVVKRLRADGYLVHGDMGGTSLNRYGARSKRDASGYLKGFPDLTIILDDGVVLWIELKAKTGNVKKEQRALHAELASKGHNCYVVKADNDIDAYIKILENIKKIKKSIDTP